MERAGDARAGIRSFGRVSIAGRTLRRDRWWTFPLVTFPVPATFVAYATSAAPANRDCYADAYLSPFYSPCLSTRCGAVPGSHGAPHPGRLWRPYLCHHRRVPALPAKPGTSGRRGAASASAEETLSWPQ